MRYGYVCLRFLPLRHRGTCLEGRSQSHSLARLPRVRVAEQKKMGAAGKPNTRELSKLSDSRWTGEGTGKIKKRK